MKTREELEKEIENEARFYSRHENFYNHDTDSSETFAQECFIAGAKSDIAKEYHTQGMFTQHQVDMMYSEDEVKELFKAIKVTQEFTKQFGLPCDIVELFEENKKK